MPVSMKLARAARLVAKRPRQRVAAVEGFRGHGDEERLLAAWDAALDGVTSKPGKWVRPEAGRWLIAPRPIRLWRACVHIPLGRGWRASALARVCARAPAMACRGSSAPSSAFGVPGGRMARVLKGA